MLKVAFPVLLVAFAGAFVSFPARAQVSSALQIEGRTLGLTQRELKALTDLGGLAQGGAPAAQDAALAVARREAVSPDARYVFAIYQLELGRHRRDDAMRAEALDFLIASGMAPSWKIGGYLDVRGGIAFKARDLDTARKLWTRLLAMKPNDPDVLGNLAQVHAAQNDSSGAAQLLERAIAARKAAGKPASEGWYRQRLSIAQGGPVEPAIAAARALVAAYPTPKNWRDAMVVYRQLAAPRDSLEIDLLRLMRMAGILARADEYQRLAQLLNQGGLAAEARSVLDEGLARGLLQAAGSPTREIIVEVDRALPRERSRLQAATAGPEQADMLLGAGRHSEAATLYRAALSRGGVNAVQLNTRLGLVLVRAGRRAEAEAAFRAAASGAATEIGPARYADLAQFWLTWLAQPPAS